MPYPHLIRLRGPWEVVPQPPTAQDVAAPQQNVSLGPFSPPPTLRRAVISPVTRAAGPPARVRMPARWQDIPHSPQTTELRLCRHFGAPPLESHEQVWLVIAGLAPAAACELNGSPLTLVPTTPNHHACDISSLLAPRNLLTVIVPPPPVDSTHAAAPLTTPGPFREARLEIRAADP